MNQLPVLAEWQMCCPGQLGAMSPAESPYDDLLPSVQGQLLPLRNHEYEIKKKALDSLTEQKLLEKAD